MIKISDTILNQSFQDLLDLALGTRSGHMTKYMYLENGADYEEFLNQCQDYYLPNSERIILSHLKKCNQLLSDICTVVELGPGSIRSVLTKTVPVLSHCPLLKTYYAVDLNFQYAEQAALLVQRTLPMVQGIPIVQDFTEKINFSDNATHLFLFLGGTLGNIEEKEVVLFLKTLRSQMSRQDKLLITFDCNEDQVALGRAYNNVWTENLTKTIMFYFAHLYKHTYFTIEDLSFRYEFDIERRNVELSLIMKKDITFWHQGVYLTFRKGSKYHLVSSRKFSNDQFFWYIKQAGFRVLKELSREDNSISGVLLAVEG